ncbi:hypothetical protein LJC61_03805 [Ruminococcaceae bacterium OttesenSCG-928-A16]|nr:hypothetical protein [Ruminococcaceae bacterium OttesenSCG-928-A16]
MKTKKRSFVVAVTVLSLVALLLVSFTLAYLTDQRSTLNVLGIGTGGDNGDTPTVRIELTEPGFAGTEGAVTTPMNPGTENEYSKVELYNVLPGQKVDKDPTITNTGAEAVYVRVKILDENDAVVDLNSATLAVLGASVDATNWTQKGDYWYLNSTLAVGASAKLFTNNGTADEPYTMMIPADKSNQDLADIMGLLNLNIIAESIQSRAFTPDMTAAEPWTVEGTGDPVVIIPAIRA